MQIKLSEETIGAFPVCYMRRVGTYGAENYMLMEKMKGWLREQQLYNEDTTIYAVPLDNPETTEPSQCRYDVCVADNGKMNADGDELQHRVLEGGRYAILQIAHTPEAVGQAWAEGFGILERHF